MATTSELDFGAVPLPPRFSRRVAEVPADGDGLPTLQEVLSASPPPHDAPVWPPDLGNDNDNRPPSVSSASVGSSASRSRRRFRRRRPSLRTPPTPQHGPTPASSRAGGDFGEATPYSGGGGYRSAGHSAGRGGSAMSLGTRATEPEETPAPTATPAAAILRPQDQLKEVPVPMIRAAVEEFCPTLRETLGLTVQISQMLGTHESQQQAYALAKEDIRAKPCFDETDERVLDACLTSMAAQNRGLGDSLEALDTEQAHLTITVVILHKRRIALEAAHFDQIFRQSQDYLKAMTQRQTSLAQATQARAKELKDRATAFLLSLSRAMKLPVLPVAATTAAGSTAAAAGDATSGGGGGGGDAASVDSSSSEESDSSSDEEED